MHERAHARVAERLRADFPQVVPVLLDGEGRFAREGQELAPDAVRAEAMWASTDVLIGGPARAFFRCALKSPVLRWMQCGNAGMDDPVFGSLADKGVTLCNSNATASAIGEFVLHGVLEAFQPVFERREAQEARRWQRFGFREIAGSTWLIVGLGNIGAEVAQRARAFGAATIGVRRSPSGREPVDRTITPDAMPEVLPEAQVVVLCAALNDQTRHMVDEAFLARMRDDSVLVNVGRGALVDEAALLASLERGVPGRAVLDVFETEPLPPESPFWGHRRVRVTAHCAAFGSGLPARNDRLFLDNLRRYLDGRPLRFRVEGDSRSGLRFLGDIA